MASPAARRGRPRGRTSHWPTAQGEPSFRAAYLALVALVIFAPQLLGGVFAESIVAIAVGGLICLGLTCLDLSKKRRRIPVTAPVVLVVAALAWTVVQALPMPCWLITWISPDSARALEDSMAALGLSRGPWCTISRAPGNTRMEILKGIAIAGAFLTAYTLSSLGLRRRVVMAVALSSLIMCVVGLAHLAAEATSVFGLYQPVHAASPLLAPLMNPNSMGAFLAMGVPLLLGLGGRERAADLRVMWFAATMVLTGGTLLARSRGGVAVLVGGVALFAVAVIVHRRRETSGRGTPPPVSAAGLVIGLAVAAGLALGTYAISETLMAEFSGGDLSKFALLQSTLQFAWDAPVLGHGRGAFSSVYAASHDVFVRFEYAESFPSQWASEWGQPFAVALIVALAVALWRAATTTRSLPHLGACVGVIVLAIANLMDLGLELVGVATVAAALLGAALAPARRSHRTTSSPRLNLLPIVAGTGVLGLVSILLIAPKAHETHGLELVQEVELALRDQEASQVTDLLERAMRLHPSEPLLPLAAAGRALARREDHAGRLINRAIQTAPGWAAPHELAARWLWNQGRREQAVLELRQVAKRHAPWSDHLLCEALAWDQSAAMRALPDNDQRASFLERAVRCLPMDSDAAVALNLQIIREFPDLIAPRLRQAARKTRAGQHASAIEELFELHHRHPGEWRVCRQLAATQRRADRAQDALATLGRCVEATDNKRGRKAIFAERAAIEASMGRVDAMTETVQRLIALAEGDPTSISWALRLRSRYEVQLGLDSRALKSLEEAYGVEPTDGILRRIGGLARRQGQTRRAAHVFSRLCDRNVANSADCAALDALSSGAPR